MLIDKSSNNEYPELFGGIKLVSRRRVNKNLPATEVALIATAQDVLATWEQESDFKVNWISPSEFRTLLQEYKTFVAEMKTGYQKSAALKEMKELDKKINTCLAYVKGYLFNDYGKDESVKRYKEFGIEKAGYLYRLPIDMDMRLLALQEMVSALARYKYDHQKYALNFWKEILKEYKELRDEIVQEATDTSEASEKRKDLRAQVEQILNGLIQEVKARYPKSYEQEIQRFGFTKMKY